MTTEKKRIKIRLTKSGSFRAYYYSRQQYRWFPISLTQAETLIETGQAYRVPTDWNFA